MDSENPIPPNEGACLKHNKSEPLEVQDLFPKCRLDPGPQGSLKAEVKTTSLMALCMCWWSQTPSRFACFVSSPKC